MKQYSSYKDSGIEWIGEIPSHWGEISSKRCSTLRNDKGHINEPLLSVTQDKSLVRRDENDIRVWNPSSDITGYKLVKEKDFVISLRSFEGGIEFSSIRGLVSPAYSVFTLTQDYSECSNYFRLLFKSIPFISELNKYTSGIRQGKNISYEDFSSIILPLPPLSEQDDIVSYLDDKTTKIDELIQKKLRKIDLLKEYRTSLINTVVTKGLNPNVPMKDSGIEWIGEIPSHWEVKQIKYISEVVLGKMLTPENKGDMTLKPYLRSMNIQNDTLDLSDVNEMWFSKVEMKRLLLKKGDILLNEGGDVGRTVMWNNELDECYFQNSVNRIRLLKDNPTYIKYQSILIHKMGYYDSIVSRVSIPHLTKEKLEGVKFIVPPISEQEQIVSCIDDKTSQIDKTIDIEKKKIELLKEYRQSLISNVVTGKIKVTE